MHCDTGSESIIDFKAIKLYRDTLMIRIKKPLILKTGLIIAH
jgi:hypothetical protein